MKRIVSLVSALSLASLAVAPAAQAACGTPAGFSLNDHGTPREARRFNGSLVFTSGMRVNTDGASNSYHPVGTSQGALNTICNGIAIKHRGGRFAGVRITAKAPESLSSEERCQMLLDTFRRAKAADYAALPDVEIDWFALALDPDRPGKPCIQKEGQPHPGFFVAQTAIAADPGRSVCDPGHWVDSNTIPYVTLPGSRLLPHGVRKGDLALVHRRVGGVDTLVVAVAGDVGNSDELGEGSLALHRALGNPVGWRNLRNLGDGVTTIFFPRRAARLPITAQSLEAEMENLLGALGGRDAAVACGVRR